MSPKKMVLNVLQNPLILIVNNFTIFCFNALRRSSRILHISYSSIILDCFPLDIPRLTRLIIEHRKALTRSSLAYRLAQPNM